MLLRGTRLAAVARTALVQGSHGLRARVLVRASPQAQVGASLHQCTFASSTVTRRWLCTKPDTDPRALQAMETIKESISKNDVVLFMKGIPAVPQCGFSKHVCDLLRANGLQDEQITSHNVLADDFIRKGAKEFSEWPTFPQLYVKGEFVGGCDIVMEMHVNKELGPLLEGIVKT